MAESITSFTQLRTWQKARSFASSIYKATRQFPSDEKFGITSQIRRSAVSVPANIAEGFSRNGQKEKIQFYAIARGSLSESLSHLYIAHDLGFIDRNELKLLEEQVVDIQKMLSGLVKTSQERNT